MVRKVITAVAVLVLVVLLFCVLPAQRTGAYPDWWDADWQYRIKFTIDDGDVGSGLSDFPVLVHLSSSCGKGDSDLSGIFNGKTQDSGEDIRFIIENPGPIYEVLDYEIEEWDNDPGKEAWIWVGIPTISSTEDTEFYMYYGNPDAPDGQNATAVWDSNFKAVWHLNETSGSIINDSTVNNNDGTPQNGVTLDATGQINGADTFNGTDNWTDLGTSSSLNFGASAPFTIEGWYTSTESYGPIVSFRRTTDGGPVIDICVGYDGALASAGKLMGLVRQDGGSGGYARVTGPTVNDGAWHYFVLNRNAGSTIQLFSDGVSQGTNSNSQSGGAITTNLRALGCERRWVQDGYGDAERRYLDGTIDEVRISNTARSADWIAAQHLSMTDNFVTYTNHPPHTPTLDSPPDGETGVSLTPDLIFHYSDPDGDDCTKFDLKVDDDSDFLSPEIDVTNYGGSWSSGSDITYSVSSPLSPGTQYYWKVRVFDGTVWSEWSDGSWDFTTNYPPDPPTDLGPTEYIDGRWGDDDTPTLEFTQIDPDVGDTVQYWIQIIHDIDGVVVDYTSGLIAQGATSFTVGQAADGGSYTTGGVDQTLDEGEYYWQVMSIDEHDTGGDWAVANGGEVAFRLDTTTEEGGGDKERYNTQQDVRVSAGGFPPGAAVDVYVVGDYAWEDGDDIPPVPGDTVFARKAFTADIDGNIVNALIWSHPLKVGEYDVVFDANRNGYYDAILDLVDHPNHPGFTVLPTPVGGEVHPIDKATLLTPWLVLVSAIILAGTLALIRRRTR